MKIIVTQSNKVYGPVSDETNLHDLGYPAETYYNIFSPLLAPLKTENVAKYIDPINPARSIYADVLINPWTLWDNNTKLASIRLQRDYLLNKSDWVAIRASETGTSESQAWKNYRQALRDFPSTVDVSLPIEQIVWPVSP